MKRADYKALRLIGLLWVVFSASVWGQSTPPELPQYRGVRLKNDLLILRSQADFDYIYNDLNDRLDAWYRNPEWTTAEPTTEAPCPEQMPILAAFEQQTGLASLRKRFQELECEALELGRTPEQIPDHHLGDDILAAFLNERYQLQIGTTIYYLPTKDLQFQIENADYEALAALERGANPLTLPNVVVLSGGEDCEANFTINSTPSSLTVGFTFTGLPISGNVNYVWSFGDGTSDFVKNPSHTYASSGTYTVCLTVETTEPNLCFDQKCMDIVVGDGTTCLPIFLYNESGNPGEVCFEDISNFFNNTVSWSWNFGDGSPTVNQSNPCHTFHCDKMYWVTLDITTQGGCSGSFSQPVWVNSNLCCEAQVFNSGYVYYQSDTRRIHYAQHHLNLPFFRRVFAKMKNYYLNSNGKWKLKKDDLKIETYGDVYLPSAAGCKCQIPYSVQNNKLGFNKNRLTLSVAVGKAFKAKKGYEWGAKYFVSNQLLLDKLVEIGCD